MYKSIETTTNTIKDIETTHILYKKSRKDKNLFGFLICHEINSLFSIAS